MNKQTNYSERNTFGRSLNYGQRTSMSVKDDVKSALNTMQTKTDSYGFGGKYRHNPQFEEAVYMLKAEIKKIRARGYRSDYGLESFEERNIADYKAMIVKVQELEKAYAVYAEMKANAGLQVGQQGENYYEKQTERLENGKRQ